MELERDGLSATRTGLEKALFGDAPNFDEALLAELRSRRERLQQLIRLIHAELHQQHASFAKRRQSRCRRRAVTRPALPRFP